MMQVVQQAAHKPAYQNVCRVQVGLLDLVATFITYYCHMGLQRGMLLRHLTLLFKYCLFAGLKLCSCCKHGGSAVLDKGPFKNTSGSGERHLQSATEQCSTVLSGSPGITIIPDTQARTSPFMLRDLSNT